MTTYDRILAGLTAALLVGAGVRLANGAAAPRVEWPELPRIPDAGAPPPAGPRRGAVAQALSGNVFSVTRSSPPGRFRAGAEAEPVAPPTTLELPPPPPPPPPQYRVAGTMVLGPDSAFALIDANPAEPAPEVYRVGDAVGGYRLERVGYDYVVLVGAAGEVRLPVTRVPASARSPRASLPTPSTPESSTPIPKARSSENTPPGAIPPGW